MGVTFSSPNLAGGVSTFATYPTPTTFQTSFGFAPTDTNSFGVSATVGITGGGFATITPYATFPVALGSSTVTCSPIVFPSSGDYTGSLLCGIANTDIAPGTVELAFATPVPTGPTNDVPLPSGVFEFVIATATSTTTVTSTTTLSTSTFKPSKTVTTTATQITVPTITLTGPSSTVTVSCSDTWSNSTGTVFVTKIHTVCPCDESSTTLVSSAAEQKDRRAVALGRGVSTGPTTQSANYGPPSTTYAAAYSTIYSTVTPVVTANITSTITFTATTIIRPANTTVTSDERTVTTTTQSCSPMWSAWSNKS